MSDRRGPGRPAIEVKRDVPRGVRFTADEARLVDEAAAAAGQKSSTWIRERAVAAAKRQR